LILSRCEQGEKIIEQMQRSPQNVASMI